MTWLRPARSRPTRNGELLRIEEIGRPSAVPARITTRAVDREAVVDVSDDGVGIAAADLERLFEPFYRVHADAGTPEGSGLGLAIALSLAQRNAGRLSATSQPGSGSTFRLSLPRFR